MINRCLIMTCLCMAVGMATALPALAQQHPDFKDSAAYFLPKPEGWGTEVFPLPPGFAEGFSHKGMEDIRFAPGWGKKDSTNYWSYAYLWWLDGQPAVDEASLKKNLEAYYTGLPAANNVPKEKQVAAKAVIRKARPPAGDALAFEGTVRMLDYMTHKPITLNLRIRVKDCKPGAHRAVLVEASPQGYAHPVWKEMDGLYRGLRCGEGGF